MTSPSSNWVTESSKCLRDYGVADVGQRSHAGRRKRTATEAQQKQSGADSVSVGNAELRAEITHDAEKVTPVFSLI